MKTVKTFEEISALPLKTKIYLPTETNIKWWYYAGVNPMANLSVMLISAGSVQKIDGLYLGRDSADTYYLNYDEACAALLENAKSNVSKVQRIFIDKNHQF